MDWGIIAVAGLGALSLALSWMLLATRAELTKTKADAASNAVTRKIENWAELAAELERIAGEAKQAAGDAAYVYLRILDRTLQAWRKADAFPQALNTLKLLLEECVAFLLRPDVSAQHNAVAEMGGRAAKAYELVSPLGKEPKAAAASFLESLIGKLKAIPAPSSPVTSLIVILGETLKAMKA